MTTRGVCVVDSAFLQRRGDDCVKPSAQCTVDCCIEQAEHVAPVRGVERACLGWNAQRVMLYLNQRTARKPRRRTRALRHQVTVSQHRERHAGPAFSRVRQRRHCQLRTHTGRFPGGDGYRQCAAGWFHADNLYWFRAC
jgi:hypothetical protein